MYNADRSETDRGR